MRTLLPYFLAGVLAAVLPLANAGYKPTIVLVHGAFADGASWNGVTSILRKQGYPVVAVANPLRSVHGDASYLATSCTPSRALSYSSGTPTEGS